MYAWLCFNYIYVFISLIMSGILAIGTPQLLLCQWTTQSPGHHSSQLSCETRAALFVAVANPCLSGQIPSLENVAVLTELADSYTYL